MLSVVLFAISILFTLIHLAFSRKEPLTTFLSYILFFNMGIMGFFAAYGHIFMGPEIASLIGWEGGSPFQFEIGIANLSYGVLGVLSYWTRGKFWDAAIIGWSIFLLGCMIGHVINYYTTGNAAPYNIGPSIWFFDLVLPLLVLFLWNKIP